jgi:hypothetical protein
MIITVTRQLEAILRALSRAYALQPGAADLRAADVTRLRHRSPVAVSISG